MKPNGNGRDECEHRADGCEVKEFHVVPRRREGTLCDKAMWGTQKRHGTSKLGSKGKRHEKLTRMDLKPERPMVMRVFQKMGFCLGSVVVIEVNPPGLGQGRVRSSVMCSWHWSFSFASNICLEHLQWKPIQTTYSSIFWKSKTMETKSNRILSSNCCFLCEKCEREAASLGAPGHVNRVLFSCSEIF